MMMRIWSFISRLIRIVIILAIVSAIAFAVFDYLTDKNRQVSRFDQLHYDVTLEPDGSATVVETRTYTFSRGRFTYGWFDLSADAFDIWVSEEGRPYTRLDVLPTRRQPGVRSAFF